MQRYRKRERNGYSGRRPADLEKGASLRQLRMGGSQDWSRLSVEMRRLRASDHEPQKSGGKENKKNKWDKRLKKQKKRGIILLRGMF